MALSSIAELKAKIAAKKIPEQNYATEKEITQVVEVIDPRIRNLSYSSNVLLHKCPRKFQLYKLGKHSEEPEDILGELTFDFGHAVGTGIQCLLMGQSIEKAVWTVFINWKSDLLVENPKQKKSFALAVYALQKFEAALVHGVLQDYELMYYADNKSGFECIVPAVELSFRILLPDGFVYRGHVDAILKHKFSGEILVLESKTDSGNVVAPAKYKNSSQAVGYSVVLDIIEPESSAYNVMYPVYMTKQQNWEILDFPKSHMQRALWIQELLLDVDRIKAYEAAKVYPMQGESCFDFFRECEYLNTCQLTTKYLVKDYDPEEDKELKKEYLFTFTIEDIVTGQLNRI